MKCPYCEKEMQKGFIFNARDSLRWYPGETETGGMWMEKEGSVMLARVRWVSGADAESWYCPDCRMVITPVPEIEDPLAKVRQKWDDFTDRIGQESEKRQAEREAEQRRKKRDKQRKKDPWEV